MLKQANRRWVRISMLLLILVPSYLFVFPGSQVALPNTPYELTVQPGISAESRDLVISGLKLADQYLVDTMGAMLTKKVEVRVANFTPCSPLEPILIFAAGAQVVGNRMCVNTRSGVWREALNGRPGIAMSVMAHEHYHLVQNELGCLPAPWNKEYDWLIEGGAAYIGWETAIASGHLEREWVDNIFRRIRASSRDVGQLASYERGIGGNASYHLANMAVQQLIEKAGSPTSLNQFCMRVGQGVPWRSAFEQTFGITLEAFYKEFEEARQAAAPR